MEAVKILERSHELPGVEGAERSDGGGGNWHDHAGSTNAHACHATTPWSASDWLLPY